MHPSRICFPSRWAPVLSLCLLAASDGVLAMAVSYSTAEYVTVRSCTVAGASGCDEISSIIQGAFGGAPGSASSSAFTALSGFGSAAGSVALSGVVGAPVLRAVAVSEPGARTSTNSLALQRYTYTGATSSTRTFGGTLTYAQSIAGTGFPDGVGDGINATIELFTTTADTFEVGDTAASNFFALFDNSLADGYASLGSSQFSDSTDTAAGMGTLGVTLTLNPGDTFWVRVLLQTPAPNGSIVDAWSTLVTGWDDSANLQAAGAVPVPATLGLTLAGLVLLGATRRRA